MPKLQKTIHVITWTSVSELKFITICLGLIPRITYFINFRMTEKSRYDYEEDLQSLYEPPSEQDQQLSYAFNAALIFKNNTANKYARRHQYTLKIPTSLPRELYAKPSLNLVDSTYDKGFAAIQMCAEEELIKMKKNDQNFKFQVITLGNSDTLFGHFPNDKLFLFLSGFQIDLQEMERPFYVRPDVAHEKLRFLFYAVIMLTFLITLCIETSFVSYEKFSGINVS